MNERLRLTAEKLSIPPSLGYAPAQHAINVRNANFFQITSDRGYSDSWQKEESPEFIRFREGIVIALNIREKEVVLPFIDWIKAAYNPQLVYYPFCGWHMSPQVIFGQDRVVHLSNEDNKPFLRDIGSGIRVKGDVSKQPFRDNVFDTIFLNRHDVRGKDVGKVFAEFRRVLKEDGLFVVDKNQRNIVNYCRKNLTSVEIPEDVKASIDSSFELFRNRDREKTRRFLWWKW